ncbi:MAG: ABC transporter ATP-binding protein [ANME-2 cluster archaeon]|nr:ABC transporter ATP-binding protein [ANME-2 cluster archaeon]
MMWWLVISSIIVAKDLVKTFGEFVAVNRITFTVEKGEVFGFLGPNGAGKTTAMKMIQCVSPRTAGKLDVFGMDVNTSQSKIKRLLGVVPQETNLDPDFSVSENLMVYSRYFDMKRDDARKVTDELLDFVQLDEKKNVNIEQPSGGMKRRLILARALINRPRLLILDEPTVGLDPQARHVIWDKLRTNNLADPQCILFLLNKTLVFHLMNDLLDTLTVLIDHCNKFIFIHFPRFQEFLQYQSPYLAV